LKNIVLISPFPPAQNPRLLKEYHTLKACEYNVKVLFASRDEWANSFDNTNQDFILVGGKKGDFNYFFTRLIFKFFIKPFYKDFSIHAISFFQYLKLRKFKADLYIGHNLAALPIVVKAAKFYNAKCGFDAEDFHRQEVSDNIDSKEYRLAKYIEDKYLAQLDYITAASPLIAAEYKKLYPSLNPVVINNVFPMQNLPSFKNLEGLRTPLKLFWFSQTIGKGRGLEDVIAAMHLLKSDNLELHLLGNVSADSKLYFQSLANKIQIYYYEPIPPDDIFEFASKFDIGLALEPAFCLNNDLALSNKLFSYAVSGLTVIASKTSAQKQFMETYPSIGKTYKIGNSVALATILKYYSENRNNLNITKKASFDLAKNELNWEIESKKFMDTIKTLFK